MELLALVLINVVFGIVLYYVISIKVASSMRDYQFQKVKKEIQVYSLNFFKEAENYLSLMDAKIQILKNLLERAERFDEVSTENLKENLKNEIQDKKRKIEEQLAEKKLFVNDNIYKTDSGTASKSDKRKEDSSFSILASLGRSLQSIMGVHPVKTETDAETASFSKSIPVQSRNTLNISVGGNPFNEYANIKDENEEDTFEDFLSQPDKNEKRTDDSIVISVKSALQELPEDAGKVDKVVHLLKKGFSHADISDELGMAIPEIALIETIKIEKGRRI